MDMRQLVKDLEEKQAQVRQMGGPERIQKQHERGKLTARERMAAFFDNGVFFEVGLHGTQMGLSAGDGRDRPPADAVVCAFGKVDGRMVCSAAYDFTVKGGYYACSKLLSSARPTAIVGGNDLTAIGALHCAFDRNLKVPEQISVVGFDDITFAEYTQPALTSVQVPRQEIGRAAFQALGQMISTSEFAGREYPVQTRLITRQSTAPVPGE